MRGQIESITRLVIVLLDKGARKKCRDVVIFNCDETFQATSERGLRMV